MALAFAPFGLRPLGGSTREMIPCVLAATHAELFAGDVIIAGDSGATRLASDTVGNQAAIKGVVMSHLAADTGGVIMLAHPLRNLFEIQAVATGDTFTSEAATAGESFQLEACDASPAGDSNSLRSFIALGANNDNNDPVIVEYLAPIAGNDLIATSYPIWVVKFNLADVSTIGL